MLDNSSCPCNCHTKLTNPELCNCSTQFTPCVCPYILFNKKFNTTKKGKQKSKCVCCNLPKTVPKHKQKESIISIRLEQLAIRPVRYLKCTRNEHNLVITKLWRNRFNRQIRKSENTLFHKLAKSDFHISCCY